MKLKTSLGYEYDVEYIDGPTITSGHVLMQMHDTRRLSEIAAEFDGLEWMKRESENQCNKEFTGYSSLQRIARVADGVVLLAFGKEN